MKQSSNVYEKVVTTRRLEFNADQVLEALGIDANEGDKGEVFVRVPGGGDWSNTRLDIGTDANLVVVVTSTEEKERGAM